MNTPEMCSTGTRERSVLVPGHAPSSPLKQLRLLLSCRHISSFLSMFKLVVIGMIIVGKDPFALFGMQAPGIWEWGQGNKASVARAGPPPTF